MNDRPRVAEVYGIFEHRVSLKVWVRQYGHVLLAQYASYDCSWDGEGNCIGLRAGARPVHVMPYTETQSQPRLLIDPDHEQAIAEVYHEKTGKN